MRNLKKVLCLVLSLAMILSVMVMGTGAVYTDQTSIKNTEAVDVLTSLGVLDGYTDGSFRPNKVVTRAEMAKIITVVLNGGSKATIGSADVSTFSDMETHWALNEVEYCVSKGIIDGYQDGTFRPERTVTGTEAAKMLLTALGYDSEVKGYVGSNWAINVNVDAAQAGIYEGLTEIDPSQGMARDNIALMVYNMLNANVIEKDVDRYTSSGEIVYKYSEGVTALEKFFNETKSSRSGILANIYFNKDTKEYTYSFISTSWFDKNGLPNGDVFNAWTGQPTDNGYEDYAGYADFADQTWGYTSKTDYSEFFGQNVTAKVNGDDEIYSMVINKGGVVAEGVWVDVESPDIANSIYTNDFGNVIKIDGQKYRLDNVAKNSTPLKVVGFNEFSDEMYDLAGALNPDHVRDQYSFRAIDLDGGGDIDLFVVYPYFVLKTVKCIQDDFFRLDKLDESDGILVVGDSPLYQDDALLDYFGWGGLLQYNPSAAATFPENALAQMGLDPDVEFGEYGDVQVNGNISKDSYVQAIPAKYTVEGEDVYNVLEVKTDIATSMKSADFRITLGGTLMDGTLLYSPINKFDDLSVGETYSYVEVNTFLFLIDTEADKVGPDDYVVVVDSALENHFGPTTTGTVAKVYEAELLFSDGSTKVVNISDDTYDDAWTGWLYSYEVDKHGNYELTAVGSYFAPNDFDTYLPYEYGAPLPFYNARNSLSFDQLRQNLRTNGWYDQDKAGGYFESLSGDIYRIAPDAVVFVYDYVNDGYTVIKGSDLEKYENSNWHSWDIEVAFIGANDFVELAYVCVPMALGEGYTTVYAYIDSETIRTAENADASGNHYVTFSAITEPNVVTTFETKHEEDEGTPLQRFVYDLDDGDFVKLTLNPDGQVVFMTYVWGDYGIVEKVSDKVTKNAFELTVDFFTDVDTGIVDKDNTVVIFTDGSGRTDKTEITEDDVVFVDYRWFDWRNDNDFTVVYVLSESDYRLDTNWGYNF